MNKRQKEILQAQLDEEEKIIEEIKRTYERALRQIDSKIAALMGRTDLENLQSIIYQLDYQKALRAEISGILDIIHAEQFTSVSEYLRICYENGFVGAMYDFHGQGIPLVLPIDQEQVVKAVIMNSKISEGLYTRLGHNIAALKKTINAEVSRGIAAALSYTEIARNLSTQTGITMNKTIRIARTEGHRIAQEASYIAQVEAKEKGADIVKQWDATLDKRTRRAHAELDGQIREVDEPFEYMGHTAMYPGDFGVASLDVNCRCAVLQRAKWALDEDELETIKERASYFGLDKTKSFEDFKQRYLEGAIE